LEQALFLIYIAFIAVIAVLTFFKNWSYIPVMGVLTCAYLMVEIPAVSWQWFFVWMVIGLAIYFLYGFKHSKLREPSE
jgi:hypothetical protein